VLAQLGLASVLVSLLFVAAPRAGKPLPAAGQLNLHNDRWDAVQVEVRIDTAGSCDLDTEAWVRTLRKGQTWAVVADLPVCWRTEATPGRATSTTVWVAWQRPALDPGSVVNAEL